ncbi:MAG TPA: hypothetical protein ENI19_03230 [Candidatus Nealsonbacteria bacterium]|uniref:Uncharacterized protein n=1 Tax=marine sediment metagenome TaxID=412755 RepID=A0A0F9VRY4_9ZZZZ|nr:hypothetical protein [Candidatus Nealsonbacteria bacterium]HEB46692.1 hypothetical protein [Candidatus Nealsonbacteria bacterium]
MSNHFFDGWGKHLEKELGVRQEEIDVLGVLEDSPRDMSKPPRDGNQNTMTLSTSKGPITQTVTDEWREAILDGKVTKIIIAIKEAIASVRYDYAER